MVNFAARGFTRITWPWENFAGRSWPNLCSPVYFCSFIGLNFVFLEKTLWKGVFFCLFWSRRFEKVCAECCATGVGRVHFWTRMTRAHWPIDPSARDKPPTPINFFSQKIFTPIEFLQLLVDFTQNYGKN